MSAEKPVVVHATEQEREGMDDPVQGRVDFRTLFSGDQTPTNELTAGIAELPPGGWLGLHHHEPAEIYYVLRGDGIATLDGRDHRVGEGCAVFIPGNAEHGIRNAGSGPLHVFYTFAVDSFEQVDYHFTKAESQAQEG